MGTIPVASSSPLTAASQLVQGAVLLQDVVSAIGEQNRSHAVGSAALGGGFAGASIGAGAVGTVTALSALSAGTAAGASAGSGVLPGVGTAVGAAVGAVAGLVFGAVAGMTASGKSTGQQLRDQWRDALEEGGLAVKLHGSHHLRLADGSSYDIGKDGGATLQNQDGSKRYTFDVDWSNPIAAAVIPDVHLFVIASGVDPSRTEFDVFSRIVGQSVNAVTSNAMTLDDAQKNVRSLLQAGGASAESLAIQLEVLRHTQKISEHEYEVYLLHVNELFGSSFVPSEQATSLSQLAEYLSTTALGSSYPEALKILTSPELLNEHAEALAERLRVEAENQTELRTHVR